MKKNSIYFLFFVLFLFFVSCHKDFETDGRFIGTWVNRANNDTLTFIDDFCFYKRFYDGLKHSYEYSYDEDSITIQYQGPNMILVQPSTIHYEFNGNKLSIDFSKGYYGFESVIYLLSKNL